ncbi:GrpB family protein [Salibacterium sp. K-3]
MVKLVELQPYNPQWKVMHEQDKKKISNIFSDKCVQIEHVGSTSVPGMWAKPLIDIAVAVKSFDSVDSQVIKRLDEIGYEYVPKEDFPQRRFFRRGEWGAGTHHLHVYEGNSKEWENIILFRDYLKSHKEAFEEYLHLKKELASKHERIQYTNLKEPFIQKIIGLARKEKNM